MGHSTRLFKAALMLVTSFALACESTPEPLTLAEPLPAFTFADQTIYSGFGSAVVDGVIHASEWAGAGTLHLEARLPEGGTTPLTWYFMNDAVNLYIAAEYERSVPILHDEVRFQSDDDGAGLPRETGDDGLIVLGGDASGARFLDFSFGRGLDTVDGGTSDGAAAFRHDASSVVFEIVHPLNSNDDSHDFSLSPGRQIGAVLVFRAALKDRAFDTQYPTSTSPPYRNWVRIHLAEQFGRTQIEIDVRPDDPDNVIPCFDPDFTIRTAVLTTGQFNAGTIDANSVRIGGAAETRRRSDGSAFQQLSDVDRDGDLDMVVNVRAGDTNLNCNSTQLTLQAKTHSGVSLEGWNAVFMMIPVAIDIIPNDPDNTLPCTDPDFIVQVLILGSATFDVIRIIPGSVRVAGAEEVRRNDNGSPIRDVRQINEDPYLDMRIHIRFGDTRLNCSSTQATLRAWTTASLAIQGQDHLRMVSQ
jgi:hypothetical protein